MNKRLWSEFRLAARNLLRNRRRSVVTGLGILSGYVGLVLLSGFVANVERYMLVNTVYVNHTGHIEIFREGGLDRYLAKPRAYILTGEDLAKIDGIVRELGDDVEFTAPYLWANGLVQAGEKAVPFQAKAYTKAAADRIRDHEMVARWAPEMRPSLRELFVAGDDEIQAGVAITPALSSELGDPSVVQVLAGTIDGALNAIEVPVAFRFSTGLAMTERTGLRGSFHAFRHLLETDGATYVGVYLKSDVRARGASRELNRRFKAAGLPYEAIPFRDERIGLFYVGNMNFLYAMSSFFLLLVSGVVVLTVTNSVSMNIIERIREIGTLRAIGFKNSDICRLMAIESLTLSAFALAVGYVVAQLVSASVNAANIRYHPPGVSADIQMRLEPWLTICLAIGSILALITVLTAYLVTRKKMAVRVSALLTETST